MTLSKRCYSCGGSKKIMTLGMQFKECCVCKGSGLYTDPRIEIKAEKAKIKAENEKGKEEKSVNDTQKKDTGKNTTTNMKKH